MYVCIYVGVFVIQIHAQSSISHHTRTGSPDPLVKVGIGNTTYCTVALKKNLSPVSNPLTLVLYPTTDSFSYCRSGTSSSHSRTYSLASYIIVVL